jgi:hypothetical protein
MGMALQRQFLFLRTGFALSSARVLPAGALALEHAPG